MTSYSTSYFRFSKNCSPYRGYGQRRACLAFLMRNSPATFSVISHIYVHSGIYVCFLYIVFRSNLFSTRNHTNVVFDRIGHWRLQRWDVRWSFD